MTVDVQERKLELQLQQHTALQAKQRAVVRRKMEEADAARRRLRVRAPQGVVGLRARVYV